MLRNHFPYDTTLWDQILNEKYTTREKNRIFLLQIIIEKLRNYFKDKKVGKVFIIGSILKEGKFYEYSDIDIAVEALQEDYFRTLAEMEALIERDIDLIELETCSFRMDIQNHGLRIV